MKVIVRIDPKTFKLEVIRYDEPSIVPPIIDPPKPEEAKDGGLLKREPVPVNNESAKERKFNKPS